VHPNARLLEGLLTGLDQHDHVQMGACYVEDATFRDIAFNLHGRKKIHAMWHMICQPEGRTSDIHVSFKIVQADDLTAEVSLVDEYTFSSTGRPVKNVIVSRFRFENGLIVSQQDFCDPRAWAAMALGGVAGFLAGRIRLLRTLKARRMLSDFLQTHPEYQ
jgi:hypothetical protein